MGAQPKSTPTTPISPAASLALLVERFGRAHHDLRVSLTDRGNLRWAGL